MSADPRADRIHDVMNRIQVTRFAIEAIVASPDKAALNQARASAAVKTLRRLEEDIRELLGLRPRAESEAALAGAKDQNAHLGAEERA